MSPLQRQKKVMLAFNVIESWALFANFRLTLLFMNFILSTLVTFRVMCSLKCPTSNFLNFSIFDQMELLLFLLLVIFKEATSASPTLDCQNFEFGWQIWTVTLLTLCQKNSVLTYGFCHSISLAFSCPSPFPLPFKCCHHAWCLSTWHTIYSF